MNYVRGIQLNAVPEENRYPFNIPAVRHLRIQEGITLNKPVTFFVGENGTGKSTLIEAIAVAMGFNPEGGSRDFRFATHSPILMAYPNADILQFTESGIRKVAYQETDHYKITKQFLDTPERMIRYLLDQKM